ncbi:aldose epimerase family protein [Allostreptomyces psammosilenae]|uniref:Aldose 1-epimerase n=1 Tax=Allostreptomyces psammosilenae TaxID=1892865 RepID=A0A852ZP38_9ACTN|nr:aldose epimerase family protein [Allostreptomyces psammosilenae]NYI04139.1 aldose 1-epimerase [Allostreptomyces psammosilenae]
MSTTASGDPVRSEPFGTAPDGTPVERWTLRAGGLTARVLTLGAVLQTLEVPDRDGRVANVVLGLERAEDYPGHGAYFGAVVGRYANRIAGGRFELDGAVHTVPANDRGNALHGGPRGFDTKVWRAEAGERDGAPSLRLALTSPDGDMGFPGTLEAELVYTLHPDGRLALEYRATTDRATVVNLTHHAYFNLAGEGAGDVLGHVLRLDADAYTPVDATGIPLAGAPTPVAGTPFDFTEPRAVGERLAGPDAEGDQQIADAGGYDHNWVLRPAPADAAGGFRPVAELVEPESGRALEVWTTEDGVQFYSGNQLDGTLTGPSGRRYGPHAGLCLETQAFPDSPNRPDFPSTVLRPGEEYASRTEFRFTAR